jgi:hypothetical protein
LANLSRPGFRRWLAAAGLLWILIASGYSLYNYYHVPKHMKGADWRTYVEVLLENARPGDVLIQNYPDPGLTYHLRERMPRVLLPTSHPVDVQATEAELLRLSNTAPRIWLQPQTFKGWDAEGLVERWLDHNAYKVAEQDFGAPRLSLYLPRATVLETAVPIDARVGDWVHLTGHSLDAGTDLPDGVLEFQGELVTVHPGGTVQLILIWESLLPASGDYTVFTHLYDEADRLWGQKDSQPLGGAYPTTHWQTGETIVDRYTITVDPQAPPGEYRVAVGMYDPATGQRLPIAAQPGALLGNDRVLVTSVRVEP